MRRHFYRCVNIVVLILFLFSHNNYMKLLESNDELLGLVEEQRLQNDVIVDKWEQDYNSLQTKYTEVFVENNRLKGVELPVYDFTEAEVYLIAQCVEAEAGYYEDNAESQRYVTQVILNRLHSGKFPNSIEDIIYQKKGNVPQFSVAYNGMIYREVEAETLANVYSVLVLGSDLPEYVCYFYSEKVDENWVNTLSVYDTVDGTVFAYEDKEDY